jgi:hypothetical protein
MNKLNLCQLCEHRKEDYCNLTARDIAEYYHDTDCENYQPRGAE